jgi:hypothetical protein
VKLAARTISAFSHGQPTMLPPGMKRLAQMIFTAPLGFLHHRIKYARQFAVAHERPDTVF